MSTSSGSTSLSPTSTPPVHWLPWKQWETVGVNISRVPEEADTQVIWQAFSKEGNICSIDIFDDRHGNRGSKGRIRFRYVLISEAASIHFGVAIPYPYTPCGYQMLINLVLN